MEQVARRALAGTAGYRYEPAGTASYRGREVRRYTRTIDDTVLVDLEEWATAREFSVGTPDQCLAVTLSGHGKELYLPLASASVRVHGEWHELGDVVAEKDGRWLVPATIDEVDD
ncbi:MAG: hypothetical protein AB7F50_02510 [Fimbriimonadaceae bacterium]